MREDIHSEQEKSQSSRKLQELSPPIISQQLRPLIILPTPCLSNNITSIKRSEERSRQHDCHHPQCEEGVIELGVVFVEVLFEDAGAADEEGCSGDEEEMEDDDAYDC